jgi:hypothetical protein
MCDPANTSYMTEAIVAAAAIEASVCFKGDQHGSIVKPGGEETMDFIENFLDFPRMADLV